MTQHLETLKGILQKALNDDNQFEGYQLALSDAIYACSLSNIALETWMNPWLDHDDVEPYSNDYDYKQGVQFVAEQWDRVVSEDGKGEENV